MWSITGRCSTATALPAEPGLGTAVKHFNFPPSPSCQAEWGLFFLLGIVDTECK